MNNKEEKNWKIFDSIFKSDEEFETYCKSHNIPF